MDYYDINDIAAGYRDRMRRLAIFDPLYELDRQQRKDEDGAVVDMKGLGLLTLLFFFEEKLMRSSRTGEKDLALFLQRTAQTSYRFSDEGWQKLARSLIQTFRPADGKKKVYTFFNWEMQQEDAVEYSLLKDNKFDAGTNTQYYTLADQGLELIFATKEFYSEFQLSINQLMLRKQLEKGEFRSALKQINEMRIDVDTLTDRMAVLRHEVQRNIVSEETFDRYKKLLNDIQSRLEFEEEEFQELREFVKENRGRLYEKDYHQQESIAYAYILDIAKELESVHYNHSRLLEQSINLKNHTLRAAQESLYWVGLASFNFEQDIGAELFGPPLPLEAVEGVLHPFLGVQQTKQWSPLSVFAEQRVHDADNKPRVDNFEEPGDEKETARDTETVRRNYAVLMKKLLEAWDRGFDTLEGVLEAVKDNNDQELLEERMFYDFWMLLHQRSPLSSVPSPAETDEHRHVLDDALPLLGRRTLYVMEHSEILRPSSRFSIQNMTFSLEEHADV
ncbi:replicative DNA helicase [Salicibibacter cibarius]|uniref:Replicative DNA helicase n=1 Tax=Salicibibacter cibarius TaxID=2743000 RepID=A0A7T6Z474_9BACI|nr:replicative DNA helicase [Salicibibacter cibarius]QQK76506.1 replicative DNA helicase [Salicibibacter cibarius]